MSSTRFSVRDDGSAESLPDEETLARNKRLWITTYTNGWLCTACLVGSWPNTLLRSHQVICDDVCARLVERVTARTGQTLPVLRGRVSGADDDARARLAAWRSARLADVFDRAEELGVPTTRRVRANGLVVRQSVRAVLDRPDLLEQSYAARIARFADWATAHGADGLDEAAVSDALDDVDALASELETATRRAQLRRARTELEDAERLTASAHEQLAEAHDTLRRLGAGD